MIELRGLTKAFGDFKALDGVELAVGPSEIVGLLGENGAGKSTLLNVVGGVLAPTAGQLLWDNHPITLHSPRDATQLGIGVVHQHFMLVPVFTVAENIALHATAGGALYRAADWTGRVRQWATSLGWSIDPTQRVEDLSVGQRQRVEILKALFANAEALPTIGDSQSAIRNPQSAIARLLLLDEPTANLTPSEVDDLFSMLRGLREQGRGVVFVSHKLNEVMALCDRVVVLRHGKIVGMREVRETNVEDLAGLMVGREYRRVDRPPPVNRGTASPRLVIDKLCGSQLRDVSLTACSGEIIGLAGVDGNGQHELVEVLSGLSKPQSGRFRVIQADGNGSSAMAVIPPDRQTVGLIQSLDLAENMALHPALRAACRRRLGFDWAAARARTRELMAQFDVRAPATAERTLAGNLSGGNQQKLVIARALSFPHVVVVAADPTRGLDIAATQFVHEQLRAAAAAGAAVLLVSTDLDEVLQLSDRIGVLYEGRLLPGPDLLPGDSDREVVGALMGGMSTPEAQRHRENTRMED